MRLVALAVCLLASAASADPVGYYGNTLLIKRTTGTGRLVYRPDHSFTLHTIAGDTVQGTWHVTGEKLCLEPTRSPMKPFCVRDDPMHKAGDTWPTISPDGIHEQLTLVPGQS